MISFRDVDFAISDASDISEIFPFLIYFAVAKKGKPYSILGMFFFISGSIKIFTLITAALSINNMPEYHLLALLEIAFVYSFYQALTKRSIHRFVIVFLIVLYFANTYLQPVNEKFNSNTWVLTAVLIMVIGLNYFYRIYKNDETVEPLTARPDFIITVGWLIYAAGSLFPYLMGIKILTGPATGFFKNAWIIQCIANISKNSLISYGFWLTKKHV